MALFQRRKTPETPKIKLVNVHKAFGRKKVLDGVQKALIATAKAEVLAKGTPDLIDDAGGNKGSIPVRVTKKKQTPFGVCFFSFSMPDFSSKICPVSTMPLLQYHIDSAIIIKDYSRKDNCYETHHYFVAFDMPCAVRLWPIK